MTKRKWESSVISRINRKGVRKMETKKEQIAKFVRDNPNMFTRKQIAERMSLPQHTVDNNIVRLGISGMVKSDRKKRKLCKDSGTVNVVKINATTKSIRLPANLIESFNASSFVWKKESGKITIEPVC